MKRILLSCLSAGTAALIFSSYSGGPYQNGAGNRSGSVASTAGCGGTGCHAAASSSVNMTIQVIADGSSTVTSYIPGKTYRVVVGAFVAGSYPKFGFQSSVVRTSNNSVQAGTLAPGGRTDISVRTAANPNVIEHNTKLSGTVALGNTIDSVSFLWTAPNPGVGDVTIFAALNAVNNDTKETGDAPNLMSATLSQSTVGVSNQAWQALQVYPSPASAFLAVKSPASGAGVARIWDMSGRVVAEQSLRFAGDEAKVDVSRLVAGNYFIAVELAGKHFGTSFTKQ